MRPPFPRRRRRRPDPEARAAVLFLLPSLAGTAVFVLLPFAETVRRSFTNALGTQGAGLANYRAVLGNAGLFILCLRGAGVAALESPVPRGELIEFKLDNDQLRIDGNMAIAWSSTLNFTVEKSTRSLIGSAVSGEGLVNVYRGTGTVLMAPVV